MTPSPPAPAGSTPVGLRRELGRWDLTAMGVNQVIGGGIFLMPAALAAQIGGWSWIAVGIVGVVALLIALNFGEAGSRFEGTGGTYLYTREAFGRFPSFEVGWMMWLTRVTSWSSVLNGLADALGFYWPGIRVGTPRALMMTVIVAVLTGINVRGIRQSALFINTMTIGKLLPLALFVVVGLPYVSTAGLVPDTGLTLPTMATSALYLIFVYGGYENVSLPAGECRDPKRDLPFAMVAIILIVMVVMTLVQTVALGTFPGLAASRTPLADASILFLGAAGAFLLTGGAVVSMTGNNFGSLFAGSRVLYALSEQGDLPAIFGRVHRRFRTPAFAIYVTAVATLALALSGSFAWLAAASGLARLLVYAGTCASVLALRRKGPAPFTIPGGPTVPVLALAVSVAILFGVDAQQWQVGVGAMVVGAILYAVAKFEVRSAK